MNLYHFLIFFGASFSLALILTPLIKRMAIDKGYVAIPKADRWHKKETALLGGIGIFTAFIIVWVIAANILGWSSFGMSFLPVIFCASGMFALGLIDDIYNIMPQHKLAGQIVIAAILVIFGFRLDWTLSKTINLFISIIWLVGITNAFNLLDNMDGLSAGIALIAGLFLFLIQYPNTTQYY